MSVDLILADLVAGLTTGLLYALVAIGLSLVFGIAKVLFLTHGELYMLGSILTFYFVQKLGIGYVQALVIVTLITGSLGLAIERFLRPLRDQEIPTLIITLAIAMLIANQALNLFGEQTQVVTSSLWSGTIELAGINIEGQRIAVVVVALVVVLILHLFIKRTKLGRAARAVAQDREAALLQGVDIDRSYATTFFISCAAAGLAGVLVAPIYYVDVFSGGPTLIKTFMVVVLGGLGSFPGAVVGGLFVGLVESFGYTFIGGRAVLITFGIVILVLIIRPRGLLGRE